MADDDTNMRKASMSGPSPFVDRIGIISMQDVVRLTFMEQGFEESDVHFRASATMRLDTLKELRDMLSNVIDDVESGDDD